MLSVRLDPLVQSVLGGPRQVHALDELPGGPIGFEGPASRSVENLRQMPRGTQIDVLRFVCLRRASIGVPRFVSGYANANHQGGGSGYTTTASTPEGKGKGPGQRGGPTSGQAASSQHTSQVCVFLTDGKNGCVAPRGDALKVCQWCGNKFHMECMRFKFKVPYCIA